MSRVISACVLVGTVFFALPAPTQTTPGTDWRTGDLFVSVGDPAFRDSKGKYALFTAAGEPTNVRLVDKNRGYTAGCTVEPATGYLWTTSADGNTISRFDDIRSSLGEYSLLQTINVRAFTSVNGQLRGSVTSVVFDSNGNLYAGTTDGTNKLLKFSPDGTLLDSFMMPFGSGGISSFDLSSDQHTIYYTSPQDTIVRRYDLATRSALPNFATLIDGSIHSVRLLPNDQGLLVGGSIGVTRLATSGQFISRYWIRDTRFMGLSIAPDGESFWTYSDLGHLYHFDLASEQLLAGPLASGFNRVHGICAKDEYLAATDTCRIVGGAGEEGIMKCPVVETCSNQVDDDGDGLVDEADADCQVPGILHEPLTTLPSDPLATQK